MDAERLMDRARNSMANAYAPYSGFRVGAVVETAEEETFTGCNIENRSYGLSVCAERVALFKAASEGRTPASIAIYADGGNSQPCGACRQVMNEMNPDMRVFFLQDGQLVKTTARELLPSPFEPES